MKNVFLSERDIHLLEIPNKEGVKGFANPANSHLTVSFDCSTAYEQLSRKHRRFSFDSICISAFSFKVYSSVFGLHASIGAGRLGTSNEKLSGEIE